MESFFVRYRNLIVLVILLVAQIVGLATQVHRTSSGRNFYDPGDSSGVRLIRLWANALVSPPERAVQTSRSGLGGIWQNYFDLIHVRQQNKQLQETVDRLRLEQAALLEDARQGQRLQQLLNFQQHYPYSTTAAQVIGTSGSDQSRVFVIDKGRDEGVTRDMAVISANGIVGKVRDSFAHSSQVLAINDQSSGAGVILETTRIRGILRGNAAGQPEIVGILADQRIKPGENVLTAGGDQIFPRGLPVGVVQKVVQDPDRDGFIEVIVKPDANLDKLDEVLVITSMQPRFNDQQMKDMEASQQLKGSDALAVQEQKKASEVMAERLPSINEPNAPGSANGSAGTPSASGSTGTPAPLVAPKIVPPRHPDRFSPGSAATPEPQDARPVSPERPPSGTQGQAPQRRLPKANPKPQRRP